MSGFLLIDKPPHMTSHDVIDRVRRVTGERRVGHAGTLDPFATGLLIVAVGREATRELSKFAKLDKTYQATFVLGAASNTDDVTGTITRSPGWTPSGKDFLEDRIQKALKQFVGEIEQIPPAYSAIKIHGQKMYEAARKGKPLQAKPRRLTVYSITLLSHSQTLQPNSIEMTSEGLLSIHVIIHCSSGTYIRAIARDLGKSLGTGGYVQSLRRTRIGPFAIEECTPMENSKMIPIKTALLRL